MPVPRLLLSALPEGLARSLSILKDLQKCIQAPMEFVCLTHLREGCSNPANVAFMPEQQERTDIMAKQIVMDHTGDRRYAFNLQDAQELAQAEQRFRQLTRIVSRGVV